MSERHAFVGSLAIVVAVMLCWLAACAPDTADELTGDAAIGRGVAQRSGCMACHGPRGEGGSGPKFIGLADSIVKLADGTSVVADDTYLAEATSKPAARTTAGYATMPANTLTPVEIAQIVSYIRALKGPTPTPIGSTAPTK